MNWLNNFTQLSKDLTNESYCKIIGLKIPIHS